MLEIFILSNISNIIEEYQKKIDDFTHRIKSAWCFRKILLKLKVNFIR